MYSFTSYFDLLHVDVSTMSNGRPLSTAVYEGSWTGLVADGL